MTGFGRILADLNRAGVRYVLIGGIALIRHGVVRATADVEPVLDPSEANLRRLRALIADWGATLPDGSPLPSDAVGVGRSIHLATPHGDLDFLGERAPPLTYSELSARADYRRVDGVIGITPAARSAMFLRRYVLDRSFRPGAAVAREAVGQRSFR